MVVDCRHSADCHDCKIIMRYTFALLVTVCVTLAGCLSTPAIVSYKGLPVNAISAGSMTCRDPYTLEQDCSLGIATLRVRLNNLTFRVASTSDGRIILVMSELDGMSVPTQYQTELAGDAVQVLAATLNATTLKLEGLARGPFVRGYILRFDKDVYTKLKESAVDN